MEEKTDLRIIKTKEALQAGITNLISKKPFNKITVNDICNEANINRITFYKHYSDKYDLLDDIINSFKNDFLNSVSQGIQNETNSKNIKKRIRVIIAVCLEQCLKYQNIILAITNDESNSIIQFMSYNAITDCVFKLLDDFEFKKDTNIELISAYTIGGITSLIMHWLRHQNEYSRLKLTNLIEAQLVNTYYTYIKN